MADGNGNKFVTYRSLADTVESNQEKFDDINVKISKIEKTMYVGFTILTLAVASPKVGGPTVPKILSALFKNLPS